MTVDLHPYVRIVETDHIATRLYVVELHDGTEWLRGSVALPIEAARRSAGWFSDVLRHAEDCGQPRATSDETVRALRAELEKACRERDAAYQYRDTTVANFEDEVARLVEDVERLRATIAAGLERERELCRVLGANEIEAALPAADRVTSDNRRMHDLISGLVAARTSGRLRRDPAVWDSDAATQLRRGAQAVFDILSESMEQGGYSAGTIVERLREVGVPVTVSCLHGHGLQFVANAITDYAEREFLPKDGENA